MRFFSLLRLSFLLVLLPLAGANDGDPRNVVICLGHGNSTNSNYEANMLSLAAMLRSETSPADPGVETHHIIGDLPDGVFAVSRCRNDTDSSSCRACVTMALQEARTACPYHRESEFFNGNCSLRLLPAVHFSDLVLVVSPETGRTMVLDIVKRNLSLAIVFQAIGFAWLIFLLLQDSRNRKRCSEMRSRCLPYGDKLSNQSATTELSVESAPSNQSAITQLSEESAPSFNGYFPTST